ncbi:integration host factor subunit alpha [Deltaproteobacteria bacterium TL4]
MVKVDIIRAIQLKEGISYGESEYLVNQLLEFVKSNLENGESVLISGFGKFELKNKKPRPGRDPKTKKEYDISARRVVTFYPSKVWRTELNGEE